MSTPYPADRTALLLVDPYNDFLSAGGKLYERARSVIEAVGTIDNLRHVVAAFRAARLPIFYVPHHRAQPSDFAGWRNVTPYQQGAHHAQVFAVGTWGGEWHVDFVPRPQDIVVKEHWSSGFAGTDLDMQLRQRGIERVVLVGMLANTCIEATGRYAMELGYHVTLVSDATAAFTPEAMHAAHTINGPTYAHDIMTTEALLGLLPAPTPG
jgi:nicotinamidase-related amidase